ncbi:MAG TPA: T9SS type A sorting domain-containing protein [Bacteroidia bacterium]|nr:T9SS type A sorting domain-containing protein [Bacteroidia bacterium]
MKNRRAKPILVLMIAVLTASPAFSQCAGGSNQGAIVPTAVWQTVVVTTGAGIGRYLTFAATAGTTYEFSYCPANGGSAIFDTQITILDNFNVWVGAPGYNDDFCGVQSFVSWPATGTATFRVLTNLFVCADNPSNATLAYRLVVPPPPMCYTDVVIGYLPDAVGGTSLALLDDEWSGVIGMPFNFCFDGNSYNQLLIGSNNLVTFDLSLAGGFCPWQISFAIPSTSDPMNSIMAPWEDILPPNGGTISYQTLGVAPNRRFIVNWFQVPMFSCVGQIYTSQLKLFETTNCIEMHLGDKPVCPTWNDGRAIQGVHNISGTQAYAVPGRNSPTQWVVVNDGRQIYPLCIPCNAGGPCLSPLPIELLSFDCLTKTSGIQLKWSTATEINNDYFKIERTMDGIIFETIGIVDGAGNSNQVRNYSFTDNNPDKGANNYRLTQVDFDGRSETFNPIACEFKSGGPSVVSVYTVSGQFIKSFTSSDFRTDINALSLADGMYLIEIVSGNEQTYLKHFRSNGYFSYGE